MISGCINKKIPEKHLNTITKGKIIYLVIHNGHSGIVVKQQDIPKALWPEKSDFPNDVFIEVGWGDREYYMAKKATSGLALKAAFLPTSGVLHVAGVSKRVEAFFPDNKVIEFMVTAEGIHRLCRYIHNSYRRDKNHNSFYLGKGKYEYSKFYLAKGTFSLLNTCNTWSGRALKHAGIPINTFLLITVDVLQNEAAKYGRVIQ